MTQFKKSTELLKAASPSDLSSIVGVSSTGQLLSATAEQVRPALLQGIDLGCIMDGVFVAYSDNSTGLTQLVKPHLWPSKQAYGNTATGVAIAEGGKILIVAPTETKAMLSSQRLPNNQSETIDRRIQMESFNGQANTISMIQRSSDSATCDTIDYAPGYCNTYSRTNAKGYGIKAGAWWLPSAGELMMIFANRYRINYALSLITGSNQILDGNYWTSAEVPAGAMALEMTIGTYWTSGFGNKHSVRPVTGYPEK